MSNRSKLASVSAMCALVLIGGCRPGPWYRVVETWDSDAHALTMRIRKFSDKSIFGEQCYFVVDAAASSSSAWREILSWYDESCLPMRRDHVRFVGDHSVYAYDSINYAITTDAGGHWSRWNVSSTSSELKSHQGIYIDEVHVSPGGSGSMVLYYYPEVTGVFYAQYRTTDFGVHWVKQPCDGALLATFRCHQ